MTLAVGGFSIGIVFAVAAHNVVTDFLRPTAPPAEEGALAHVPIYATATAPAAADTVTRSRSRSVAKVTLPSIGTRGPLPSAATDGRGGNDNGRAGEALGGEPNAAASAQAVANASIPASESVAEIKPADETAAAASEPPKAKRKARTRRTAKKRRRSNYASGYQNNFFGWGGGYGGRQYYARQQYYGRRQYY
jgi:hypothetical protein